MAGANAATARNAGPFIMLRWSRCNTKWFGMEVMDYNGRGTWTLISFAQFRVLLSSRSLMIRSRGSSSRNLLIEPTFRITLAAQSWVLRLLEGKNLVTYVVS
jgi:hypothetical protein